MKKNLEFSVIIPVYNCEPYIKKCLNSILNQEYSSYELIIIDDGSNDNSQNIVDDYKRKYKNIKVLHKQNGGVSAARNDGIELASGKYITFVDCDDYVVEDYFLKLHSIVEQHPNLDLYNFGFFSDIEDVNGNILSQDKINYKNSLYSSRREIKNNLVELYDNTMLYNPVNKIYVRDIIAKYNIRFPDYNWGEDIEFNRNYLLKIKSMYNSNVCLYHYIREREYSITKKYKEDLFQIRKKEFFEFNDYFDVWNIKKMDYYEFSCRRYVERVIGCVENEFCAKKSFRIRYKNIKAMLNDKLTIEAIKNMTPKSKKVKLMIIPMKYKLILPTFMMGSSIHFIKDMNPSLFNKLKNKR